MRRVIRFGGKAYALLLTLPLLAGALVSLWLIAIDPLDRRPWGDPPRLAPINYPSIVLPTVTRQNQQVLVVGSSALMAIKSEQLRRIFDVSSAANITYEKPFPIDQGALLNRALMTPGLKHVIFEVGHTWFLGERKSEQPGRRLLAALNTDWFTLPEVDETIIYATKELNNGQPLSSPEWEKRFSKYAPAKASMLPQFQRDRMRKAARAKADDFYAFVPTSADCDFFPQLRHSLTIAFKRARDRGILFDLVFAPIPFSAYPLMQETIGVPLKISNLFQRQIQLHRCVMTIAEAENSEKIMVHQVSALPTVVGDEQGLRDPFHYDEPAKFDLFLALIRERRHALTSANFDDYHRKLSQAITAALKAQKETKQ